jgi:hypothetical protein
MLNIQEGNRQQNAKSKLQLKTVDVLAIIADGEVGGQSAKCS